MEAGSTLVQLVIALGAALAGASVAIAFRQPLVLGYLLAGVAIGPFTPGIVGSTEQIAELAEVGIVLLMFVIGAQLSLAELLRASRVAVIGGLLQVSVMIGVGYVVGRALGWSQVASYAFGAVVSNSSSTVIGKILGDRGELDSRHAQLALAWSSVQDISSVLLVAALTFVSADAREVGTLLAKSAVFFVVVVPLSFWGIPHLLRQASSARSREFFALAVITLALAMAAGAALLGVSLALGAFLTGVVVGESDLAHRILGDAAPIRDVFSGVFFVSVGMLVDPGFLLDAWPLVLLTVALIVLVKGGVSAVLARLLGASPRLAVLVGAALAQSAEFSFLIARFGLERGVLPLPIFHLLLGASSITILLAPFVADAGPWLHRRLGHTTQDPESESRARSAAELVDHAIVCGHGRVGGAVRALLERHGKPVVVIEEDLRSVEALRTHGTRVVLGDAGLEQVLEQAGVAHAGLLILCIPERMAVRRAVAYARARRPEITILARTHDDDDRLILEKLGADEAVLGEKELALELGRRALARFGVDTEAAEQSLDALRRAPPAA